MSEVKFTKGPWGVAINSAGSVEVVFKGGSPVRGDEYLSIMPRSSVSGDEDVNSGETATANAHLIKSAPKMYEMLGIASREIYQLINEVNKLRMSEVNCATETPPDLHDMETCHLIAELLAEARGE